MKGCCPSPSATAPASLHSAPCRSRAPTSLDERAARSMSLCPIPSENYQPGQTRTPSRCCSSRPFPDLAPPSPPPPPAHPPPRLFSTPVPGLASGFAAAPPRAASDVFPFALFLLHPPSAINPASSTSPTAKLIHNPLRRFTRSRLRISSGVFVTPPWWPRPLQAAGNG